MFDSWELEKQQEFLDFCEKEMQLEEKDAQLEEKDAQLGKKDALLREKDVQIQMLMKKLEEYKK